MRTSYFGSAYNFLHRSVGYPFVSSRNEARDIIGRWVEQGQEVTAVNIQHAEPVLPNAFINLTKANVKMVPLATIDNIDVNNDIKNHPNKDNLPVASKIHIKNGEVRKIKN